VLPDVRGGHKNFTKSSTDGGFAQLFEVYIMRSLKLASLFLVSGSISMSVACSSDSGSGDDGDDSVGAQPAGDGDVVGDGDVSTGGTGGGTGDGDTGGTGGDTVAGGACLSTATATGTPALIDDFEDGDNLPLESDGRVGQWAHGHWITPAGQDPDFTGGYLTAACVEDAWCNTAWDMANPWGQWASIDLAITLYDAEGVNCYDASVHTGIKFMARGGSADQKLRVQLRTPDANADKGETYQGPEIALTTEWAEYSVPFADIKQPSWSTVGLPLNPAQLVSISWVVRTREDQTDDMDMVVGEKLTPYNVQLDDVAFY
jgi:hypothetical protein